MLKVLVVEKTGEARSRACEFVQGLLPVDASSLEYLPRFDLSACSPDELRFRDAPSILIIGPSIINEDLVSAGALRRIHQTSACIAILPARKADLSTVEHLARMGIDDVVSPDITSTEFQNRLILIARRIARPRSGKLVLVESAKGGVGVTSLVAGMGEAAIAQGLRACVVDLDFETQDLSRFLQARPFISESLQQILDGERAISSEYTEQACVPVQVGQYEMACVPPPPESDAVHESRPDLIRRLVAFTEALDTEYDLVLIDAGACHGNSLRVLERVSDVVLCVVTNDAAALYASIDKVRKIRAQMSPTGKLVVVENAAVGTGLDSSLMREEFRRLAGLAKEEWAAPVPYSKASATWPGSGNTIFSLLGSKLRRPIEALVETVAGSAKTRNGSAEATPERRRAFLSRFFLRSSDKESLLPKPLPAGAPVPLLDADAGKSRADLKPHDKKSQTKLEKSVFTELQDEAPVEGGYTSPGISGPEVPTTPSAFVSRARLV